MMHELRRRPWLYSAVAMTMAFAGGIAAVLAGCVDVLFVRPLTHVRQPASIVELATVSTFHEFELIRQALPELQTAAYRRRQIAGRIHDVDRDLSLECVTAGFFPLLGVSPVIGRQPSAELGDDVAIVSFGLWKRDYDRGDRSAAGLQMGSRWFRIVGVMPRGFTGLRIEEIDVWLPMESDADICTTHGSLDSPGATISAVARLDGRLSVPQLGARIASVQGMAIGRSTAGVVTPLSGNYQSAHVQEARTVTAATFGALLFAMVASLSSMGILALRALRRSHEMSIRRQVGATKRQLVRHICHEQMMVFGVTMALSFVVVIVFARTIGSMVPFSTIEASLNWRTFGFLVVIVSLTLLPGALIAVAKASSHDSAAGRAPASVSRRERHVAVILLVGQTALAFLLIGGAVAAWRSVQHLWREAGFTIDNVVAAAVDAQRTGYMSDESRVAAFDAFLSRAHRLSGVLNSAVTSGDLLRMLNGGSHTIVRPSGPIPPALAAIPLPEIHGVSIGYFNTVQTSFVAGRPFREDDIRINHPVIVLDARLAAAGWTLDRALGQCAFVGSSRTCFQIVGVTQPRRAMFLAASTPEAFLLLGSAAARDVRSSTVPKLLLMRLDERSRISLEEIQRELSSAAPGIAVSVKRVSDLAGQQAQAWRFAAAIFSLLGVAGALVGAVSLYATLAYWVHQRRGDIAIRMALGASRAQIGSQLSRDVLRIVTIGSVVGMAVLLAVRRPFESVLFGTNAAGAEVLSATLATLLAAGMAASIVPVIKATRTDPAALLRN